MTRDCKSEPEQTEPREFVSKRTGIPRPLTPSENDKMQNSPVSFQNLTVCKSPVEIEKEKDKDKEGRRKEEIENKEMENLSPPASSDCITSDIGVHTSNITTTCSLVNPPIICSRSPGNCDPLPGPSNMPPVQQVPLSLKREADWSSADDRHTAETPVSEYARRCHDTEMDSSVREDSPRLYPCMYCGNSFPHQSKLTRHILSHSLETLKYREQRQSHASLSVTEPLNFMDFSGRIPATPHEPPDPTDQPPTTMDLELNEAAAAAVGSSSGGVVLCKFCGKSFPDVSSLITHLPVHTGDRPFKCEFCGKAFKLRHHMKDHCRVHTGERPFRCALCGKTFSRSTILKAHEKTHYPKYVRKFLSPSPLDTEEENPH